MHSSGIEPAVVDDAQSGASRTNCTDPMLSVCNVGLAASPDYGVVEEPEDFPKILLLSETFAKAASSFDMDSV